MPDEPPRGCNIHSVRGSQGGFTWSSQHLDVRGCDGQACWLDDRVDGTFGDEVAGQAGDNPAMESFFALLQKNVLDRRPWATRQERRIAIVTWIERTSHRRRRQARLGRSTPIEYETIMTPRAAIAA